MNIDLPEPSGGVPANCRVSGHLIGAIDESVVVVKGLGRSGVVVVPSELKHATAIVDISRFASLVVGVGGETGLEVGLAVDFLRVLESNGFPDGVSQEFGSLGFVGY